MNWLALASLAARSISSRDEPGLPYHRVVAAGGRLGRFGRSPLLKAQLLTAEGLTVRRGRIVGFSKTRWIW